MKKYLKKIKIVNKMFITFQKKIFFLMRFSKTFLRFSKTVSKLKIENYSLENTDRNQYI